MERQQRLFGYARTSAADQQAGFEARLVELNTYECERTYQKQVSAVATSAQLERAIDMLREGEKLAVTKLDRLVRSVSHMGDLLEQIEGELLSVLERSLTESLVASLMRH